MNLRSLTQKIKFILTECKGFSSKAKLFIETTKLFFRSWFTKPHNNNVFQLSLKNVSILYLKNPDLATFYEIFMNKVYEFPFKVSKQPIIVDAGSHIGFASLFFLHLYPKASIYCLEPDTYNFELLKKNVPNQTLINKALSDHSGIRHLSKSTLSVNHHLSTKGQPVSSISIRDLIKIYSIEKIDLFKIDIEGHEEILFRNIEDWIDKVENIIIELHDTLSYNQWKTIVENHGFSTKKLNSVEGDNIAVAFRVK